MRRNRTLTAVLTAVVVALAGLIASCVASGSPQGTGTSQHQTSQGGGSNSDSDSGSGIGTIAASDLPPEAQHTLDLIDQGGPYPYPDHDDKTFGNREGILPEEPDGYYREYTVETPGSDDRGARRIIKGDQGELYYTDDHYESFKRIER